MKRADRPLRRASFGLACGLLALLPAAPAIAEDGSFTGSMLRELNRVRGSHGLSSVREDKRMDRGALGHSRDMARRGYFAHGSWTGRVMASAGSARSVGEVIGWRVRSSPRSEASNMVREWLGSSTHRQVLLNGDFSRIGVGRATATSGGKPTALYTVDFAG